MRGTYQTRQRRAVLEFLSRHGERQFTVDELLTAMGDDAPGRSTAYRLLERLAEEGAVRRFLPEGSHTAAFQATTTGRCDAHLHLKCTGCGRLIHLDDALTDAVQAQLLRCADFAVDDSRTTIFGVCAACRAGEGTPDAP